MIALISDSRDSGRRGTLKQLAKREYRAFKGALVSIGVYAILGAAAGIVLILLSMKWEEELSPAWRTILEHLGDGFLVSSLVVILYEWRSHAKMALDLCRRYAEMMKVEGKSKLRLVLDELLTDEIGGDRVREDIQSLARGCEELILALVDLKEDHGWAIDQYIGFIAGLHQTIIVENMTAFRDLRAGDQTFELPRSPAAITDEILAAQMEATVKGDRYDVISDFFSWEQSNLRKFTEASGDAIKRGVQIRRIFNVVRGEPESCTEEDVEQILREHVAMMKDWSDGDPNHGSYQVRLFSWSEYQAAGQSPRLKQDLEQIRRAHWGIFRHRDDDQDVEVVKFRVARQDLSRLVLSKDKNPILEDLDLFESCFGMSRELTADTIGEVVKDYRSRKGQPRKGEMSLATQTRSKRE